MSLIRFTDFFSVFFHHFFLQSGSNGSNTIIDYLIIFLGPGAVLFFTFYLLWAGRRKNHRIIKLAREALLETFSEEFDDLIIDQLSSNGGLLIPVYKKSHVPPFKDFRVVFALEERHLMLSVIFSWFSGANDYIAFEANARKGKLPTKIQILPLSEEGHIKKHQDLLFSLDEVKLGISKLDDFFIIKATSIRSGSYFLNDKDLLKQIYSLRNSLIRISIDSADDPPIRVYARINKELDLSKFYTLFILLCNRINTVAEKVVMRKGHS